MCGILLDNVSKYVIIKQKAGDIMVIRFKKVLVAWHWAGAIIIMALAALWHFFYSWAPGGFSAVIFPVNESVWENVKLFLFPSIIFYIIEYFAIGNRFRNYIFAHGITLLAMPVLTLALFYFYRDGLAIQENLTIDIIITFISICIGLYIGYKITIHKRKIGYGLIALFIAVILAVSYGVLTFFPPKKPIFLDTNTNGYGIEGFEDNSHDTNHSN